MLLKIGSFAAVLLFAVQVGAAQGSTDKVLTVCEALSQPQRFHGSIISIRGIETSTGEGKWIRGVNCKPFAADGHEWPSLIALDTPPVTNIPTDFKFDSESMSRVYEQFQQRFRKFPEQCVEFTYTGLFQTRLDWSKARVVNVEGKMRFVGFGHQGEAPALLILKSIDRVSVVPNCG